MRKEPQDLSADEWDHVLDVNLRAAFLAAKAVYPAMKARGGGKLINIGSMFSIFGGGGSGAPYSSSKGGNRAAVQEPGRCLGEGQHPVQCHPAGVVYDGADPGGSGSTQPERYDLICKRIPSGRWGDPKELQGTTVFLASAASDYVTGAVIGVDGGYSVF